MTVFQTAALSKTVSQKSVIVTFIFSFPYLIMRLQISYVRPCGERDKVAGRIDLNEKLDLAKLKLPGKVSAELGVLKTEVNGKEILVFEDHVDILKAESEHEILRLMGTLKQIIEGT
jgi:hypothetical protein